ncbi:unnamed protein product [Moneuplotes crassus]|uniref:Myb-like DNA-binding domain containing protein n=1 Tax=Euplotes crassus TaxID=5936 RepID=A0AAD1XIJ1_EUPCR|nr:unnamed protein product [Moneuplotes crassus]
MERVGPWTMEEDIRLITSLLRTNYKDWKAVQVAVGCRNLTKCQMRFKRYYSHLIDAKWTEKEDNQILKFVAAHGVNNWENCKIRKRADRDIMFRWYSYLDPYMSVIIKSHKDQEKLEEMEKEAAKENQRVDHSTKRTRRKKRRRKEEQKNSEEILHNSNIKIESGPVFVVDRKTKWTFDQEKLLFQCYQKYGPCWSRFKFAFWNKSSQELKAHFYEILELTKSKSSINDTYILNYVKEAALSFNASVKDLPQDICDKIENSQSRKSSCDSENSSSTMSSPIKLKIKRVGQNQSESSNNSNNSNSAQN